MIPNDDFIGADIGSSLGTGTVTRLHLSKEEMDMVLKYRQNTDSLQILAASDELKRIVSGCIDIITNDVFRTNEVPRLVEDRLQDAIGNYMDKLNTYIRAKDKLKD